MTATDGLVIVDKPAGWTSHDVVGRLRRLAGTRKVGHAGTLDPMATGVLVLGVGRATRLLGHLSLTDKEYLATIRLGVSTVTDDADGDVLHRVDASFVGDVRPAMATLTGRIEQVPSAVSAIKVDGVRSYQRVRSGEAVTLAPRPVTVSHFELVERRQHDLDVRVTCSSGTYVRALARDLGNRLGVGGHLTALRRTRVGPFALDAASTLDALADQLEVIGLDDAVARSFPRRDLVAAEAVDLSHGRSLLATGTAGATGAFGPDGRCVALIHDVDATARPIVVFAPALAG